MILRITTARVREGRETEAFEVLRKAVEDAHRPDGLEGFVLARRIVEKHLELTAISTWRDFEAMIAIMGKNWQEPSWLPGLTGLVEPGTVAHYETLAEDFDEFKILDPSVSVLMATVSPA